MQDCNISVEYKSGWYVEKILIENKIGYKRYWRSKFTGNYYEEEPKLRDLKDFILHYYIPFIDDNLWLFISYLIDKRISLLKNLNCSIDKNSLKPTIDDKYRELKDSLCHI